MINTQSKIDLEVDAMAVLGKLIIYNNGYYWTLNTLRFFLGWKAMRILATTTWLMRKGLISKNLGIFKHTDDGIEYYEGARLKPEFSVNTTDWKNEALTGLCKPRNDRVDGDWQRSDMTMAAIPDGMSHRKEYQSPEDILFEKEDRKRLEMREKWAAKSLNLSVSEFRTMVKSGQARQCDGLDGVSPHIGKFRKNGTQLHCLECQKKTRNKWNQ